MILNELDVHRRIFNRRKIIEKWNFWTLLTVRFHRHMVDNKCYDNFRQESIRNIWKVESVVEKCSRIPSASTVQKKHSQHTRVFPFVWTTTQVEWTLNVVYIRKRKKNEALTHVSSVNANSRKNILTKIFLLMLLLTVQRNGERAGKKNSDEKRVTFRFDLFFFFFLYSFRTFLTARESCYEMWNQHYWSWNNENIMCWFFKLSEPLALLLILLARDFESGWSWRRIDTFRVN